MPFCKNHLPRKDTPVILESETGEEFEIKYIAEKTGLSAGWRKYCTAHKLVEGDVLVFQLVAPTRFKVTLQVSSFKQFFTCLTKLCALFICHTLLVHLPVQSVADNCVY